MSLFGKMTRLEPPHLQMPSEVKNHFGRNFRRAGMKTSDQYWDYEMVTSRTSAFPPLTPMPEAHSAWGMRARRRRFPRHRRASRTRLLPSPAGCRSHPLPQAGEGGAGAQRRVPRDNFPSPKIIATGSLPLLALAEQQRCSPKADRGPLRWGMRRCGH